MTAAIALIIGIADFTWQIGTLTFTGIALGSIAALVVYHGMRASASCAAPGRRDRPSLRRFLELCPASGTSGV